MSNLYNEGTKKKGLELVIIKYSWCWYFNRFTQHGFLSGPPTWNAWKIVLERKGSNPKKKKLLAS